MDAPEQLREATAEIIDQLEGARNRAERAAKERDQVKEELGAELEKEQRRNERLRRSAVEHRRENNAWRDVFSATAVNRMGKAVSYLYNLQQRIRGDLENERAAADPDGERIEQLERQVEEIEEAREFLAGAVEQVEAIHS